LRLSHGAYISVFFVTARFFWQVFYFFRKSHILVVYNRASNYKGCENYYILKGPDMKNILAVLLVLFALPISSHAQQSDIAISGEWARPIIIAGRPGSAYFHIENNGSEADKLVSVTSSVSPRVELHEHTMKDGIMKMGQVMAIEVPAGGSVDLEPGGYHIMIFESTRKYGAGEEIDLTLTFEKAGEFKKTVKVLSQPPNN